MKNKRPWQSPNSQLDTRYEVGHYLVVYGSRDYTVQLKFRVWTITFEEDQTRLCVVIGGRGIVFLANFMFSSIGF